MNFLKQALLTVICGANVVSVINAQSVEADVDQINFGLVEYGQSATEQVTLTNLLNIDIDIEEVTYFDFYGSIPFEVANMPASIAANGTATFDIVFTPIHNMMYNTEIVIKTSGNRGSIAIDVLGDCTYDNAYYADSYNLIDEDLEAALKEIVSDGYDEHGYDGARDEMFMVVDNQQVNGQGASQNTLTRAYLGTDAVGYTSRQNAQSSFSLNTEHTFPQGNFNQALPMRSDLHHLFVTDIDANSTRSNFAFGNVEVSDWSEGGSLRGTNSDGTIVFEPRDGHKGLTSRAVLYFVIRYQNYGGFLTANQEEVLREWSELYPPIQAEIKRNDDIQAYQNNRNPFTDYPQFLKRIYSIRLDQDRPNVAIMNLSAEEVDFMDLESGVTATYSLVVTNSGERFMSITNAALEGNDSNVYGLSSDLPSNIVINPGESFVFDIEATPSSTSDDLTANLVYTTNVPGNQNVEIPINASNVLGLFELAYEERIVLAPNPFDQSLRVISSNTSFDYIVMYDMMGRICLQEDLNNNHISVSELPAGFYQAQLVKTDGTVIVQKLIKR
jgi:endonuclease I